MNGYSYSYRRHLQCPKHSANPTFFFVTDAVPLIIKSAPTLKSLKLLKYKDDEGVDQSFCLEQKVSARWQDFGILLGLESNQLEIWRHECKVNKCWIKVMDHWLKQSNSRSDYPPTWDGLYTLLDDVELSGVADKLKEVVSKISNS